MATAAVEETADPFRAIPDELKARPQWVTWRYEERKGKLTKVPYTPRTGNAASVDKPQTWGAYEQAYAAMMGRRHDGIGYVFAPDDPYTGVDLDHCRGEASGELSDVARVIVDSFASYAEASPSGSGVHIFIRATMPDGRGRKSPDYEAYNQERFFTVTGRQIEGTPATIEERQAELDAFCAKYFAPKQKAAPNATRPRPTLTSSDEDVVRRMCQFNPRAAALWDGDRSAYGDDESRSDAALISHLDYWTDGDREQMCRLFTRSRLYRPEEKWPNNPEGYVYHSVDAWQRDHPNARHYSDDRVEDSPRLRAVQGDAQEPEPEPTPAAEAAPQNQLNDEEPPDELARLRAENAAFRAERAQIRAIIDADGTQVDPLEKVIQIDLLLNTFTSDRRDANGFVRITIEAPRDEKTGKIKGRPGLADKHGASRGKVSEALKNINAYGTARIETTDPEITSKGVRCFTLVAPPERFAPKWERPGGPRKQMGGARPGAGRKPKRGEPCDTPGCDGTLTELRGVETKEHETSETICPRCRTVHVERHYTGTVTTVGFRHYSPEQNQLILASESAESAGGNQTSSPPVEGLHKLEIPHEREIPQPTAASMTGPEYRAELRAYLREYGEGYDWPRLPYAPARSIPAGRAAWERFIAGADMADLLDAGRASARELAPIGASVASGAEVA